MPPFGSSPLSRGIRSRDKESAGSTGIIPALAGNTTARRTSTTSGADHPRSRGEYQKAGQRRNARTGSSPLSRGILLHNLVVAVRFRIIPALAGNTTPRPGNSSPGRDHPRSRGEYGGFYFRTRTGLGSSPLSRGIHLRESPGKHIKRIIPALAGNTGRRHRLRLREPDHPRSRGEYPRRRPCWGRPEGSSPLSRGIRC